VCGKIVGLAVITAVFDSFDYSRLKNKSVIYPPSLLRS